MELLLCNKEEITRIYETHLVNDFPKAEVKPLKRILLLADIGMYFAYGLYCDGELISYAFFSCSNDTDYVLLDYFATIAGRRGEGIGAKMLELLKSEICKTKSGIILETEDPDFACDEADFKIRTRRVNFYTRCGLEHTKIRTTLFGVNYKILVSSKRAISTLSVTHAVTALYHTLIAEKHLKDNVSIIISD